MLDRWISALKGTDSRLERKTAKPLTHKHKCDECATIWEHVQLTNVSDEVYHAGHDCPQCGRNQRVVYMATAQDRENRTKEVIQTDPEMALLLLVAALAIGGDKGEEIVNKFKRAIDG